MPMVHQSLWDAGIKPRYGQVTMIAGQPNAGKSMFALHLAIEWAKQGLWGYLFSADTDEGDTKRRACAALTGTPLSEVESDLETEEMEAWYEDRLEALRDLRWAFKSDPDFDFINAELEAFQEAYGAHPDFMVVDNLVNLIGDAPPNDKGGLLEMQLGLKSIARTTGMAVIVLHHCKEGGLDPYKPGPRKSVQNMVNELPEQIFTVAYDPEQGRFGVAGVKLRGAKADPNADRPVFLSADFSRCEFKALVETYQPNIPAQDRWWNE